jgi:hypothetical protein
MSWDPAAALHSRSTNEQPDVTSLMRARTATTIMERLPRYEKA